MAGAGWLWVTAPPYRVGVFSMHLIPRAHTGAGNIGALENATVFRLNFANAKFPPPVGGAFG